MRLLKFSIFLVLAIFSASINSAEDKVQRLKNILAQQLPAAQLQRLSPSPVKGIYEAVYEGQVFYITSDGRHIFQGRLIDVANGRDLTKSILDGSREKRVNKLPEDTMVIFTPKGETKYTITTFTDIDCPYCRKMHSEMDRLHAYGIRVRYLFYPRAGVGSESYKKAVAVWCAKDRQAAMTKAKLGETIEMKDCDNPVKEHMALAISFGLLGTPLTITETGEKIAGYLPATKLLKKLQAGKL